MKIEVLPSVVGCGGAGRQQFCTTVIVDDRVAIDAGTLGILCPMERQQRIQHVFLSHSHLDHLATLPLFLNNVYLPGPNCVTVYASSDTQDCLRRDMFNDRLWPDFLRLSKEKSPFLELVTVESEKSIDLTGLSVMPVALDHLVPTLGFIVQSPTGAVAFISDTGPTERVWELLNCEPKLKAVFLEASFPNSHRWLAETADHLCPELFEAELNKLDAQVPVFAYHLHPGLLDEIAGELSAIPRHEVSIVQPGREYIFE